MQESLFLHRDDKHVAQTLLDFFARYRLIYYKRGEIILRGDEPDGYVYCSKKGYIMTYSISPKGHRDVRSFSRPSTFFPVSDFFVPLEAEVYLPSRTIYFEALTEVYLWRAPEQDFRALIQSVPAAQTALLKQVSLNHRFSMARIEMLQLRDVNLRMIALFLSLAFAFGRPTGKGSIIRAPISHQLIADSLSVARETVSRELARLKAQGLIDYSPNCIELYDLQKLKRMVEDY